MHEIRISSSNKWRTLERGARCALFELVDLLLEALDRVVRVHHLRGQWGRDAVNEPNERRSLDPVASTA